MYDKRSLINLALAHLIEEGVSQADLVEDPPSPKVAKMLAQYDAASATAQARAPWQCCLHFDTLTRSDTIAGDWRHDYVFALPDGALNVWTVDCLSTDRWAQGVHVDGASAAIKVVRTDFEGPLYVAYTRMTPEAGWDPLLAEAFALELASRTAGPIKNDEALAERLARRAQTAYMTARGVEGPREQGQGDMLPTSGLTAARLGALT